MKKNTYLNNAIVGNGRVTVGLDEMGRILRMYYPSPDYKNILKELEVAFKIGEEYIHVCGTDYDTIYNQKYVENTSILKTEMYISGQKVKIVQTDFAPINENVYIRYYEITNEGQEKITVEPMIHSAIYKNFNDGASSYILQDALIHYNHEYNIAVFSKDSIEKYKVNDSERKDDILNYFEDLEHIENEYVGLSNASTIACKKIEIIPSETVMFPVYIYLNKYEEGKNIFEIESEIIRIKKINVKDREKETKRHWEKLVQERTKHDLTKFSLKEIETYTRSIILLEMLRNAKTGGVIAALEVDEAHKKSGGYGFVWPRDTYYVMKAYNIMGKSEYTKKYLEVFAKKTQSRNGRWEQRFYSDTRLAPSWGYQIDETATIILIAYDYYMYTGDVETLKNNIAMLQNGYKYLLKYVEKVIVGKNTYTFDIWENTQEDTIYGMGSVFAAINAMKKIYEIVKEEYAENRLKVEQINKEIIKIPQIIVEIKEWIHKKMYDQEKGAYVNSVGKKKIDISVLTLVEPFGVFTPYEKRMENTKILIDMHLKTYSGGYLRYESDGYMGGKNPWSLATMMIAEYNARMENKEQVKEIIKYIANTTNVHSYIAEQINPETLKPAWVIGLSWAHGMYISLIDRLGEME